MDGKWNTRSPAVKRILQELKEIQRDDNPDILAEALEENIFEWHFVIRGAWDTEFEGGIYHGRILMPAEYPFKPPAFVMLTPSGRFETGVKICLSISSFHPESWQPSWSVRSALTALIAFMQTPGNGAVGSLDHPADVRKEIAAEARANPPKHANPDRQALINRLHQEMLDLEEKSRSIHKQAVTPPPTPSQPTTEQGGENEDNQEHVVRDDNDNSKVEEQQDSAEATTQVQPTETTLEQQEQPEVVVTEEPPAQQQHAQEEEEPSPPPLVVPPPAVNSHTARIPTYNTESAAETSSSSQVPTTSTTLTKPVEKPPQFENKSQIAHPSSSSEQQLQQQIVEPQRMVVHNPPHHHAAAVSWEDRGLTYLAVLLIVGIIAILLRRVFVTVKFDHNDEFFSVNPVAEVEL